MLEGKTTVIFDLDGTLLNSVGVWNEVDRRLIAAIRGDGADTDPDDIQEKRDRLLREFSSKYNPYLAYSGMLGKLYGSDLTPEEILAKRGAISDVLLREVVDYKPFADTFVRMLKERGFRLIIASTTRRRNIDTYRLENVNVAKKAPFDDYFDRVYTKEDVAEAKPSPEIYLKVLSDYGLDPSDCIIFEDALVGVESAKAAGIFCCAVYDSYAEADREKIEELADAKIKDFSVLIRELKEGA